MSIPPAVRQTDAPALPLRILLADDSAINRQILAVFLRKLGHSVDVVEDGAQAVARFSPDTCDLVIMDVMMPVMEGYEATRRIKAACGERWVPVIFLSALDQDANLVVGLDAGGDEYLAKPVNFTVIEAKLRSLSRTLVLHRELERTRRDLQTYHDAREAENRLAIEIFNQFMQSPGLADPALHYWMVPASDFSGDIAAAARAPDGRFYALLADATGHGLAAAISVLPVMTLFYDLARTGLPLGRIVAKINSQLRIVLPPGRFVACSFLCTDPARGISELWLGGLPPALLLDAEGRVLREFVAEHLPLGIEDADWRNAATTILDPPPGAQIVLPSDGLTEAANAAGEEFGMARLRAALASAPAGQRLDAVRDAVLTHMGGIAPHDDVTLMLIDLTDRQ